VVVVVVVAVVVAWFGTFVVAVCDWVKVTERYPANLLVVAIYDGFACTFVFEDLINKHTDLLVKVVVLYAGVHVCKVHSHSDKIAVVGGGGGGGGAVLLLLLLLLLLLILVYSVVEVFNNIGVVNIPADISICVEGCFVVVENIVE